ncbi:hypothetical protein M427DRAFT_59607 [Gonapodya prolifera JEL478]|uniref:Uncharacterized protein n=1 Tax=Gonapodya prolifera (strain JEL478) TaxID=1344416 RepID=A0A139A6L9_GONPJ|nr:hypothetical protein M427DRAFT_59607 [Gonapodya prolifera JEL478]|eukprot:KXS12466.1 hypothetical protein M427DRAFT_59607 [Gonapodya prolifera JEL478]
MTHESGLRFLDETRELHSDEFQSATVQYLRDSDSRISFFELTDLAYFAPAFDAPRAFNNQ